MFFHTSRSGALPRRGSGLGGGEMAGWLPDIIPATVQIKVNEFLVTRLNIVRHVRDALVDSQDKQKEQYDAKGRCVLNVIRS